MQSISVMDSVQNIMEQRSRPQSKRIKGRKRKNIGPRTPPSIPSKYDSQNLKVAESAPGFGNDFKKLKDERSHKILGPGPGSYHIEHGYTMGARKSGTVSSRGSTPMISLDPRFGSDLDEMQKRLLPGPGTYMPNMVASKPSAPRVNFGMHQKSIKRKPEERISGPGPGSYESTSKPVRNNVGAASFKFTARKDSDLLLQQDTQVAVGSYDIGAVYDFMDRLGKEPRKGKDFPDPVFRSQCSRLAPTESTSLAPAPGYYEVVEPQDRDKLYRPSACFDTGLDRFGKSSNVSISREEDTTPAPGSYNPVQVLRKSSEGAIASFASTSNRFESNILKDIGPGPQTYRPMTVPRKSFLQNRFKQWV